MIDEAHYFLHEPNIGDLLDLTLGAYTLVTYRMSDLHPRLRHAIDVVIMKQTKEPREKEAMAEILQTKGLPIVMNLATLGTDEAVLLLGVQESAEKCVKFTLFPRLTSHVRHKAKYQDLQLVAEQGFWFTEQSHPSAGPARSLKELLAMLDRAPSAVVAGHVRRGDFSRWIAGAFRDHALASQVRKVEQRFRLGHVRDLTQSISRLIQERYEFSLDRDKDAVIPLPALERN